MSRQILNFLIHLRLHYQFFILSGGYLLGALYVEQVSWETFWLQFLNVHVLLFGGATAYNSYWDKDEGPVGGLKSPPKMNTWMWPVSLMMQFAGLIWGWMTLGVNYAVIYALSIFFFWLYSTPVARWKGKPLLSLVAIGVSTGTNSFFMGYLAAGDVPISWMHDLTALGVAFIMLSLYPASQIYQTEEDQKRGDDTFAIRFGLKGVKRLYTVFFITGVLLISLTLYNQQALTGLVFGSVSVPTFLFISYIIWGLEGKTEEYSQVMKIKFLASFSFVVFIVSVMAVRHLL